jgi:thioredoxin 1
MSLEQVTDSNFKERVLDAGVPVVVDFWAAWCGPCRMLAPILEEAAGFYGDKLRIVKLDTERNRKTSEAFGIKSLPTMLVFKDGEVTDAMVGVRSPGDIKDMFDRAVKPPGLLSRLFGKKKKDGGDESSEAS